MKSFMSSYDPKQSIRARTFSSKATLKCLLEPNPRSLVFERPAWNQELHGDGIVPALETRLSKDKDSALPPPYLAFPSTSARRARLRWILEKIGGKASLELLASLDEKATDSSTDVKVLEP